MSEEAKLDLDSSDRSCLSSLLLINNMVYFLSDCHLGAGYIVDPRAQEKALAAWLDSIAADASALYLLGDIIDYWFEYRNVVPRGYTRFLGALARLADKGVEIVWLKR